MNFLFECPHCGKYTVDQQTLLSSITPDLQQKLKERIETGLVANVVAEFTPDCMRCHPHSEYTVRLNIESVPEE